MFRMRLWNLWYDGKEFLRRHRGKLIAVAFVCLAGLVLGIRGAFAVSDPGSYLWAHPTNAFRFVTHRKGVFSYFLITVLVYAVLLSLLALSSVHICTAYLCFPILFAYSYLFSLYLCLYCMYFKLYIVPFVLLCLLPCYLLTISVYALVTASAIARAAELRRYGCSPDTVFSIYLRKMLFPLCVLVILSVLAAILSYFLALGIIL